MKTEFRFFTTTPYPLHIFFRCYCHSANECLSSKEYISFSTSRTISPRPLPARCPAFSCRSITFLRNPIATATTRLQLLLLIRISSYVLWRLAQEGSQPGPCRAVDLSFASRVSQQFDLITGKHFQVSPLSKLTSKKLS